MNTNTSTVQNLRDLFPTVGGVGPERLFPRDIERELRRAGMTNISTVTWLKPITDVMSASARVGLTITVNDIARVVRESLESLGKTSRPFPSMYKGVSFNPQTYGQSRGTGEWIVILDFFAILRAIINTKTDAPPRFFVLDAGLYWIANLLGESLAPEGDSSEAASQEIISKLAAALKEARFSEVITTNRIRNAYLRAISDLFPANSAPPVISLRDVWFDPEFLPFLSRALTVFCRKSGKKWSVARPVAYERYMPYSPWVTPLAAAETVFMGVKLKVRGILSPTAEAAWNKVNDQLSLAMNTTPFISWMYVRKLGKILSYQSVPFLSDDEKTIERKLIAARNLDATTPDLIVGLISPFVGEASKEAQTFLRSGNTKKLAGFIANFLKPVEKKAAELFMSGDIPVTPLDQAGWLGEFPPGIC